MVDMNEKAVLHRGYCVKSPPVSFHRWHKRFCSLTLEEISNTLHFHKTYNKDYNKSFLNSTDFSSPSQHLVFSYFKDEEEEAKDNALKKFLVGSAVVIDYQPGANDYTYVIKLLLGPLYNDREILLCFKEKSDHQKWMKAFDSGKNTSRDDSLELTIRSPVQKFEAVTDSPLKVELERIRSTVSEESETVSRPTEGHSHNNTR